MHLQCTYVAYSVTLIYCNYPALLMNGLSFMMHTEYNCTFPAVNRFCTLQNRFQFYFGILARHWSVVRSRWAFCIYIISRSFKVNEEKIPYIYINVTDIIKKKVVNGCFLFYSKISFRGNISFIKNIDTSSFFPIKFQIKVSHYYDAP